jgi:hypothetical protein
MAAADEKAAGQTFTGQFRGRPMSGVDCARRVRCLDALREGDDAVHKIVMGLAGLGLVGAMSAGCAHEPPSVERVTVAAPGNRDARIEYDRPRPLPDDARLWDRDREYHPEPPIGQRPGTPTPTPRPSTEKPGDLK